MNVRREEARTVMAIQNVNFHGNSSQESDSSQNETSSSTSSLDRNSSLHNSSVAGHTIDRRKNTTRSHKKFLQAVIATSLILMSIALLSIPIVIYYMNSPGNKKDLQLPSQVVDLETCQGAMDVDISELNSTKLEVMRSCSKSTTEQDNVSSESDTLAVLLYISSQLGNKQCENTLLQLCAVDHDKEGCINHENCSIIRDTVCAVEWRLAENVFNISEPSFGCCSNGSRQPENTPPLNCTDEFILTCDSICILSCEKYSQFSETVTHVYFKLFIFTGNSLMIGATIVIFLSIVKRETMFTFPQTYLICGNICLFILGFCLTLPRYLGQGKAFCSDPTLTLSLSNPTIICQIVGFGVFASLTTYSEFWFLHIFHTLLKIAYPFSAKRLESWHYFKVVYAGEVITAVVLGCFQFAVISFMKKFTMMQFPAFICYPDDVTLAFYTFALPLILLQMTGTSATIILAMVLYNHMSKSQLHKSSVLKLSLCSKSIQLHISTPVVKIIFVFLCYTAVLVMNWMSFINILVNQHEILESIQNYELCLASGDQLDQQSKAMCELDQERIQEFSKPVFVAVNSVMLGLLPYFGVIYIVRMRTILKNVIKPIKYMHDTINELETQYS